MLPITRIRLLVVLVCLTAACSDPTAPPTPQKVVSMDRAWSFLIQRDPDFGAHQLGNSRVQPTGVLTDRVEFGPELLVPTGLQPVGEAEVFSNATGTTYWSDAQAPQASAINDSATGTGSELLQTFTYVVDSSANPVLKATISHSKMEQADFDPFSRAPNGCTSEEESTGFCNEPLVAGFAFEFTASRPDGTVLRWNQSTVSLQGHIADWHKVMVTELAPAPVFDTSDFLLEDDVDHDNIGTHSRLSLIHPVTLAVPLDGLVQGDTVLIRSDLLLWAEDRIQGESFSAAYFRDPLSENGLALEAQGLHLVSTAPRPFVIPTPSCSGTPGSGGSLSFSAPTFQTSESGFFNGRVRVTRSGSTTGAVSVKLTTNGGTATSGTDYDPVSTIIRFGDGKGGSRVVRIPLRGDTILEPNETVGLSLSEAGGCATLGLTSAALTIVDDDLHQVTPRFSVGGTVSGLTGSGLVLRDVKSGLAANPTSDGPFVTDPERLDGSQYEVRVETQPANPLQTCTVSNGSGTLAGANVTNIAVTCTTPTASGPIDSSFGSNGRALLSSTGAAAMALQADGKFVTVGKSKVARITSAGTLDATFGSGGQADFRFDTLSTGEIANITTAQGVVIQSNGKIVVVGFITSPGIHNECGIIRYNTDGTLDQSFGQGGKAFVTMSSISARCHDVAVSGNQIIVAGEAAYPDPNFPTFFDGDMAVARLTAAGVLDSTFGFSGFDTADVSGTVDRANVVKIQSDGKIVLAGSGAVDGGANPDIAIVRFLPNGIIDSTFNPNTPGKQLVDLPGAGETQEAVDLLIQPDGSYVIVGETLVGSSFQFLIGRFLTGGTIDPTFGTNGFTTTPFTTQGDFARGIALSAHGLMVVGRTASLGPSDFAIARYTSSGQLDPTFGNGGKVVVDLAGGIDVGEAVVVQADDKIVVAGTAQNGSSSGLGLVRINDEVNLGASASSRAQRVARRH